MRTSAFIVVIVASLMNICVASAGIKGRYETPDIGRLYRDVNYYDADLSSGVKRLFNREYEEAAICFKKSIQRSYRPEALYYLGRTLSLMGEYEKAIRTFQMGIDSLNNVRDMGLTNHFFNEIGYNYVKLGEFKKGIEFFDKAIKMGNELAAYNEVRIYANEWHYERAYDAYIMLMIRFPNSEMIHKAYIIIEGMQ